MKLPAPEFNNCAFGGLAANKPFCRFGCNPYEVADFATALRDGSRLPPALRCPCEHHRYGTPVDEDTK